MDPSTTSVTVMDVVALVVRHLLSALAGVTGVALLNSPTFTNAAITVIAGVAAVLWSYLNKEHWVQAVLDALYAPVPNTPRSKP